MSKVSRDKLDKYMRDLDTLANADPDELRYIVIKNSINNILGYIENAHNSSFNDISNILNYEDDIELSLDTYNKLSNMESKRLLNLLELYRNLENQDN